METDARARRRTLRPGLAIALLVAACNSAPADPPHGFVLIGLDTLRADALSSGGSARPTTPVLDALASDGVRFEHAITSASHTLPGFVAILSGSYFSKRVFEGRLKTSLVERFREAGYATAAFTEGGFVSRDFGFDRGFDDYWEETARVIAKPTPETGIARTFGAARAWLREHGERPFFLFVHTYEVHVPYQRRRFASELPAGSLGPTYDLRTSMQVIAGKRKVGRTEIDYVRALYDGGVAEADAEVGRLLDTLDEIGVLDRTVVAVTSDHGEELGERKPSDLGRHGHALWDTLLRVPLILRDPRQEPAVHRVAAQVRTIDILPTLLELAGISPPAEGDGRSLLPLMRGEEREDRVAYGEVHARGTGALAQAALRLGGYKLIWRATDRGSARLALYDLRADPGEREDLAEERRDVVRQLEPTLTQLRTRIEAEGRAPTDRVDQLDDRTRERLRSLGYLNGS